MIYKTKTLVACKDRNRRHGCGEGGFGFEGKPNVIRPLGDSGSHRSGALWLFGKKVDGLTFIRFQVVKLGFTAIRIDQELPTAVPHGKGGTLVLRLAPFENRVRMAILPKHRFGAPGSLS